MGAIILDYFGDWKTRLLTCPTCGWTGTFEQGSTELYEMLQDCSCPGEHGLLDRPMLAVLPFPTLKEYRKHWASLSDRDKAYVEAIEASSDRFNKGKARSADQFPDLDSTVLDLKWDQEGEETLIRFGEQVLWREPVRYEAQWRFSEMLELLKEKYGDRLRDLEPTPDSKLYLYGDSLSSAGTIDSIRRDLQAAWKANRRVK